MSDGRGTRDTWGALAALIALCALAYYPVLANGFVNFDDILFIRDNPDFNPVKFDALIRYWQSLWVAPPARWSSLRAAEFQQITGAGKDSPALPDAAEFREKCAWIPYVLEQGETTMEFIGPFTNQLYPKLDYALQDILLRGEEPRAALQKAQRETLQQIKEAKKTFVR